ncbi:hypothetical protein C1Y40_05124 [Mycobacterium talmoniae]|uniref:Uncharacterized protein n=1 Tax=Mycobacterium talmoniae TaxID=1858794 RepID=A0A2S8BDH7_9MYCO|nr:hypothetical protein C1Y40_05124 [Mycobacterium talmoniae]
MSQRRAVGLEPDKHIAQTQHMAFATRALVTAPLRGAGFDKLRRLLDVVYDPWIEAAPLRIYTPEQLADRVRAEASTCW